MQHYGISRAPSWNSFVLTCNDIMISDKNIYLYSIVTVQISYGGWWIFIWNFGICCFIPSLAAALNKSMVILKLNFQLYLITQFLFIFYASAFRLRRHYVFGLSVRPSVRSLKYPLLTCTWILWSTRPTVTVLRHVRPSVRRGFRAFARERMEGMAWNFTCWCILTIFRTD